jgi:hypothetical protein
MQPVYSSFILPPAKPALRAGPALSSTHILSSLWSCSPAGLALDTRLRPVRACLLARPLLFEETPCLPSLIPVRPCTAYCSCLPCSPSVSSASPSQAIPGLRNEHSRFSMVPADASRDEQKYVVRRRQDGQAGRNPGRRFHHPPPLCHSLFLPPPQPNPSPSSPPGRVSLKASAPARAPQCHHTRTCCRRGYTA